MITTAQGTFGVLLVPKKCPALVNIKTVVSVRQVASGGGATDVGTDPTSADPLQARKAVLDIQGPSTETGRLPQTMPAEARPTTGLRSTRVDQIPFTENRSRFSLHPSEHSPASKFDAGKDAQGSGLYVGSFPKD